jgi:serine/threonine protein kinase
MASIATSDDFLSVARKSQQIDVARLASYLGQRDKDTLPADPKKLAAQLVREGLMTSFQAQQFLLGKYKGFTLGGYRVFDRLGAGGTGTVYLAEHQIMKRRVALKVLPTPFAENTAILERFRREAQAAAALHHPNVVHVYDFRQEGALYFLVMEYIDGATLQQVLHRRGPLAISVACEYIRQAAVGLQHAHEQGLVHRDIKPANLLVDRTGTVKILDLGLARYDGGGESQVTEMFNNNAVLGTADYLAPEQAMSLHDVDGRADVYSLGATLYALLVGHPPFHTGTIGQKLMWHQTKEPEPLGALRPEVPAALAEVVMRMLAKKPEQRFATAGEVAEALIPWASEAGCQEVHPSHQPPGTPRLKRSRPKVVPVSAPRKPPTPDTWMTADEDTARFNAEEKIEDRGSSRTAAAANAEIPLLAARAAGGGKRLLLLLGLAALVGGLVVGGLGFLLWGPRTRTQVPSAAVHHP